MKQKMMGSSDIGWTICKSLSRSQTHNHASTSSLTFSQAGLLFLIPNHQPTRSKHWRQNKCISFNF